MFFVFTNIGSFTSGVFYSVKDYFLINVFGSEVYVSIIGYVNFLSAVVVIALTPLVYHFEKYSIKNENDENNNNKSTAGFWIIFAIFGACSAISLVLSYFIKEDTFDYEKIIEEKDNENEQKLITGSATVEI